MNEELAYSSSLNGASYLLFELKQIAKLKLLGMDTKEIRKKAIEDNIFQFENPTRTKKIFPSVMRRVSILDEKLASLLVEGSIEMSKIINLYAIMKTDRLFFEFMVEVIKDKLQNNDYLLEKKDLNIFFTAKAEQSERVANWSDSNTEKLKRVYMQILHESGMLADRKSGKLSRLIIHDELKNHLAQIGDQRYIQVLGE